MGRYINTDCTSEIYKKDAKTNFLWHTIQSMGERHLTVADVHEEIIQILEAAYHELKLKHGYQSMEDMVDKIWLEIQETGWDCWHAIIASNKEYR